MTESENESKPKRSIKPGRWVFRATIAVFFIATAIFGARVYRFYAAVNAVEQHAFVIGPKPKWLENLDLDFGNSYLFFSQEIVVVFPLFLDDINSKNDHQLQALIPHLQQFDPLWGLRLEGTNLGDEELSYLVDLDHLSHLYIGGAGISNHGLRHLRRLENLKSLTLYDCRISDEGVRHLQNLKRLESLNLDGTDITDEGLKHLRTLKDLKFLSLSNTGVTDEGCADLLKAIPDLEILDD